MPSSGESLRCAGLEDSPRPSRSFLRQWNPPSLTLLDRVLPPSLIPRIERNRTIRPSLVSSESEADEHEGEDDDDEEEDGAQGYEEVHQRVVHRRGREMGENQRGAPRT